MKHIRLLLADARRQQGLALIIVLSMLALATIVILAFLSVADTEHKSTTVYSASQASRRYADTAVNMVISQIRSGSAREAAGVPVIHATQPGAVRKYSQNGVFVAGYKLFSDKDMIYRAERSQVNADEKAFVADSEPPADWNSGNNIARYVDLNEPVIKGVASDAETNSSAQVFFPVIDPRAAFSADGTDAIPVEGFTYETKTALKGNDISAMPLNSTTAPILQPTGGMGVEEANQLRLAMPVQWLYVLKDGAVGYLDEGLRFMVMNDNQEPIDDSAPSSGSSDRYGVPSETNPIVGRVAFWTDDETCKVNINTASEPTFSAMPIYYHERDHRWADYPPARSEYQRFPGHPATVALSSVFYPNPFQVPNRNLDTYGPTGPVTGGDLSRALNVKEKLYDLMPRIHTGGSLAGTRTFEQDDYRASSGDSTNASAVAIQDALNERLYASVDELLFSQTSTDGKRAINNAVVTQGGQNITLFNKPSLERFSAFLTAQSRGSEINLFGLPRVAMWPIASTTNKRTGFDNLIEFCSRLGSSSNIYIFQREQSRFMSNLSATTRDIGLPRNQQLMAMLDKILDHSFPSATTAGHAVGRSFRTKLGGDALGAQNARQILISMFDYIRSTNLYDSFMVPPNRNSWPTAAVAWNAALFTARDSAQFNTYTAGIFRSSSAPTDPFADRFFPGHGQVTPSEWTIGGTTVKGFGRFVSISEIGLQFICTADGQPDMYSWRTPIKDPNSTENTDYIIPNYDPEEFDANASASVPMISGGRTALRLSEDASNKSKLEIEHDFAKGFDGSQARLTNLEDIHWTSPNYNPLMTKKRYYSNYPPLTQPGQAGRYGTVANASPPPSVNYGRYYLNHPGYDWRNWNWTLDWDTPLKVDEKRIQALLHLELFCPAVAYTEINPEFTIIVSNANNIQINGRGAFGSNSDLVIRSEHPVFETDSVPEVGGFASFRNLALGRRVNARGNVPGDNGYDSNATTDAHSGLINMDLVTNFFTVKREQDLVFDASEVTIRIYDHHVTAGTQDEPVQTIQFSMPEGRAPAPDLVTTGSYWVNYVQTDGSVYNHPPLQAPRWWTFNRDGAIGRFESVANTTPVDIDNNILLRSARGRFFRQDGVSPLNNGARAVEPQITTGYNQSVPGGQALIYTRDPANFKDVNLVPRQFMKSQRLTRIAYGPINAPENQKLGVVLEIPDSRAADPWNRPWHFGTDTVRTLQPAHGDARIIAAKKFVPATDWTIHRLWNDPDAYMAHNFSSYTAGTEAGFDRGASIYGADVNNKVRGLPEKVTVNADRSPDIPHAPSIPSRKSAAYFMQRYYDFDDSDTGGRVGPFINKVDDGNYAVGDFTLTGWPAKKKWRATYFRANGQGARFANGSGSYFTPNRQVPSPVIMGSLPSHVWDPDGAGAWTNLLFRPYVQYSQTATGALDGAEPTHPGQATPPDHYLLDLFWMPVVEPYAISESLSTAGKINLNYQMLPFTHIRRATAIHAAMKGELMAVLPNASYQQSKGVKTDWGFQGSTPPVFLSETDNKYWHRSIVVDRFKPNSGADSPWWDQTNLGERVEGTLRQFEERFNFGEGPTSGPLKDNNFRAGLFRTASQICEIHLIPSRVNSAGNPDVDKDLVKSTENRETEMGRFWGEACSTGDNTRERPYANLYAKFTTRSNTFRVHVRAQAIRKATRSVAADVFDPELDLPSGEFRGSFLLERYIDQSDLQQLGPDKVDYAAAADPFALKPLENYYRFRVLESKRFAP